MNKSLLLAAMLALAVVACSKTEPTPAPAATPAAEPAKDAAPAPAAEPAKDAAPAAVDATKK
jgi:hypothetical protein